MPLGPCTKSTPKNQLSLSEGLVSCAVKKIRETFDRFVKAGRASCCVPGHLSSPAHVLRWAGLVEQTQEAFGCEKTHLSQIRGFEVSHFSVFPAVCPTSKFPPSMLQLTMLCRALGRFFSWIFGIILMVENSFSLGYQGNDVKTLSSLFQSS